MLLSVIIPHYNNCYGLKLCLNALNKQTIPSSKFEIIVVDNGSEEDICSIVKKFDRARLIHEKKPGSYAARNTGIRYSRGEILAFTDSDCIPQHDWLENGLRALKDNHEAVLLGGKVTVSSKHKNKPTVVELYEIITAFPQEIHITESKFSVTANMFTYRWVFDKVGMFDEKRFSGGDTEWGKRVSNAGYKLIYDKHTNIIHPARLTLKDLYITIARKTAARFDRDPRFFKHFRVIPPVRRPFGKILFNKNIQGLRVKIKLLFILYFETYAPNFELILLLIAKKKPERT